MAKFDHSKPAVQISTGNFMYLEQGNSKFTNAAYNSNLKQWIPEPKPLDVAEMAMLRYEPILGQIKGELEKANKLFSDIISGIEALKPKKRNLSPHMGREVSGLLPRCHPT